MPTESAPPEPEGLEPSLARAAVLRRRRRDAAVALTILAALLLVSPLVDAVAGPVRVLGLPLGAAWLYLAWFGLILATARLARGLAADDGDG
ncbi:hypothetical protein [Amaricoccus sp.]|uniref:hypothetical protein n=1 Tax=Amaricoccus sp. TaxID=1872485 RepID=UPI001B793458|nr:hypothetical protein [Amaricoccus sp.]MBP7241289.1 hypothetical protein [Amaricoccus sp.]